MNSIVFLTSFFCSGSAVTLHKDNNARSISGEGKPLHWGERWEEQGTPGMAGGNHLGVEDLNPFNRPFTGL